MPSLGQDAWLENLLADPEFPSYGDGGFETRKGAWRKPPIVTDRMRDAARAELTCVEAYLERASRQDLVPWLESLGVLAASGKMAAGDAAMKLGAFSKLLAEEYPAGCFTDATLAKAAKTFKWFPTYAEVAEFCETQAAVLRVRKRKLDAILADGPKEARRA